jgi:hypothetical protein
MPKVSQRTAAVVAEDLEPQQEPAWELPDDDSWEPPPAEDYWDAWEPPPAEDTGDYSWDGPPAEDSWEDPAALAVFPDPEDGIPPGCGAPAAAPRPRALANVITTDAEWDVHKPGDKWVSSQFAVRGGGGDLDTVVVYFPQEVPAATRECLRRTAWRFPGACVRVVFVRHTDDTDLFAGARRELLPGAREVQLAFYFSPKDVEYAKGWTPFKIAVETHQVRQGNSLTGRVGDARLRDLKGWSGPIKLLSFARSLGIEMPEKTTLDDYKTRMWRGLLERPEDFLRYAVADALVLLDATERFTEFVQETRGLLGLPRARQLPPTLGRLVATTFEDYVEHTASAYAKAVRFCLRKLGYLDPDHADYEQNLVGRCRLLDAVRTPEALRELGRSKAGREQLRQYFHAKYLFAALSACGKSWWTSRPLTETACLNALVQGGRCHNERPDEYRIGPGLDVDISGCYGASLRTLTYPVGLPTVWSYNPNERRPRLGAWLRRHEKSLVPGLWTVTVSGRLPFAQDLLYSKITRAGALRAAGPDADLSADFALLRRELKNAVLTADLLAALRAAATAGEWAALVNLEVVTAVAYRAEDRVDGPEAWCRAVLADEHEGAAVRYDAGSRQDRRTRAWYGLPLEGFIGRLADERKACKARAKAAAAADEKARWEGLGTVLKQVINTFYGDTASRYFAMGNTVLANNITARARLGVWMVAKALGLRQCVTDGGIYEPSAVPSFRGKRPGLDTLSRMWAWKDRKHGRRTIPLPGLGWRFGAPLQDADTLALAHVNRFWAPYGLDFPFTLEHKPEHCFRAAAYWSKGDYALDTGGPEPVWRLRGKSRNDKKKDRTPHPSYTLLGNALAGGDAFPEDLGYTKGGILKVKRYLQCQNGNGYQDLRDLRPGDNLPVKEYVARFNNCHMPVDDEVTFRRRRDRKKVSRGEAVRWFERYAAEGIAAVHAHLWTDNLQGNGRARAGEEKGSKSYG